MANTKRIRNMNGKGLIQLVLWVVVTAMVIGCCWDSAVAAQERPKIVVIEFHGLKPGIIGEHLDQLPNFKEAIHGPNGNQPYIHVPDVTTIVPSASVPSIAAMYSGVWPQRTGVVSTIWFDRTDLKVHTMISFTQNKINNMLKANGIPTLFDYLTAAGRTSQSTMLMVTNGATWSIRSSVLFWANSSLYGAIQNNRWFPYKTYNDPKTVNSFITGHLTVPHKGLGGIYKARGDLPDVMVLQLLGMDLATHFPEARLAEAGASIDEIELNYARTILDPQMGRLIRFFKKIGQYHRIAFVLLSQQGANKILVRKRDKVVDDALRGEFRIPDERTRNRKADAVIMIGANTKEVYLRNRKTRQWMDAPRLMADVKPAVDRLLASTAVRDSLHAMIIRQYPGERNEGPSETEPWWDLDVAGYLAGPMDDRAFSAALQPIAVFTERFENGDRIVERVNHQYTRKTAPDIKLVNKLGHYYLRDFTKYGHHGSYFPEDMQVFFWIAGPGVCAYVDRPTTITSPASVLDLVPTVLSMTGVPMPDGLDGEDLLARLP